MTKLAPSLLAADFSRLDEQLEQISSADMLHLDIMDGNFVPNISFGPVVIESIRDKTELEFDTHLMIENPGDYIDDFVRAGSDCITFHVEATEHSHRVLQKIKSAGIKAGISLNPGTPLNNIEYILPDLDLILIMTVNPGFGGQDFIPIMEKKISQTKEMLEKSGSQAPIAVDGGLKPDNVHSVIEAGADIIVAGSAVLGQDDPASAVDEFRARFRDL